MPDSTAHAAAVDAWLAQAPAQGSADEIVRRFDRALRALWQRTQVTLGEVTLTAIVARVRELAVERHPLLAPCRVEPTGLSFEGVVLHDPPDARELTVALRFVLIEFLRVLGILTAEILTPALHDTLARVPCAPVSQPPEAL